MFSSIGITEMILIAGIALVVLGPEKFPEAAKVAAKMFRDMRGYFNDAKNELTKEMRPIQNELKELSRHDPESYLERWADSATTKDDEETEGYVENQDSGAGARTSTNDDEDDSEATYNVEPDTQEFAETFQYDSYARAQERTEPSGGESGTEPERLDG